MAGAVLSYQKTMIIRITAVSTAILRKNPLTMIDKIVKVLIRQKIAELQPRQIEAGLYFQASQESRNRKTVNLPRQMSLKSKRYKGQRLKILLSKTKNEVSEKSGASFSNAQGQKSDNQAKTSSASEFTAKTDVNLKDIIAKCKERAKTPQTQSAPLYKTLREGTRVFHQQFGVGHILKSETTGGETLYTVEFTKAGIKTLDDSSGTLKTF